jgi:hypothetical protein
VLPQGSQALIVALTNSRDPQRTELIGSMIGRSTIDADQVPILVALDAKSPALHAAVVELIAKQPAQTASTTPLLRTAALDASLPLQVREQVLNGLALVPGVDGTQVAAPIFAQLNPAGGGEDTPVDAAWRRWVGNNRRGQELDYFVELARSPRAPERTLAYAVLLQRLRGNNVQPAVRERVAPILDSAWTTPATVADVARAVRIMRLEADYAAKLQAAGAQP